MRHLKIIAALLHYPTEALVAAAAEVAAAVEVDEDLTGPERARLAAFAVELGSEDLLSLQERYCETFDRGRARSLHLFEHVHGESRDRGQAMVDLLEVYRAHGFEIAEHELPDYIPMFLEFLSVLEPREAREWLAEVAHILQVIYARLDEQGSPFAVLFEPLLRQAGAIKLPADVKDKVKSEAPDDTPEALDEAWAEEPITFGLGSAACPSARPQRPGQAVPVQWADRRGTGH